MSTKSHIHETYGTLKKLHFAQRGVLKFTYKGRFLTLNKRIWKILRLKTKLCAHALVSPLHMEVFLEKNQNLNL